jgi:hypothetical protein
MSWKHETTVDGHFVRVTGRRRATGIRYFYVQAEVWEGPEPAGAPLGAWELPAELRCTPDVAASLAVRQTDWCTKPEAVDRRLELWDYEDPECDHTPVTFVLQRVRRDGRRELLSGRDARGKINILRKAVEHGVDQPVWLKIHQGRAGVEVNNRSPVVSMIFTVGRIDKITITPVYVIVEEILAAEQIITAAEIIEEKEDRS